MFGAVKLEKIGRGKGGVDGWLQSSRALVRPDLGPVLWFAGSSLVFIVVVVVALLLSVAYLTLWERKFIGWIQIRIGPNRVGPLGCCSPSPTC
jgi:NADH-quinone oxidoreductase subunit H